jgi:hypothetical protein
LTCGFLEKNGKDKYLIRIIIIMDISSILRGLLDIIERGQAQDDSIEQANTEMLPVIDTQEIPIDAAQVEFDGENPGECGIDSSFDELDVVKRNAGLPVMVISTDGAEF